MLRTFRSVRKVMVNAAVDPKSVPDRKTIQFLVDIQERIVDYEFRILESRGPGYSSYRTELKLLMKLRNLLADSYLWNPQSGDDDKSYVFDESQVREQARNLIKTWGDELTL